MGFDFTEGGPFGGLCDVRQEGISRAPKEIIVFL